jgi:hypothetical protein
MGEGGPTVTVYRTSDDQFAWCVVGPEGLPPRFSRERFLTEGEALDAVEAELFELGEVVP